MGKIVEQGVLQMAAHYEKITVDHYCIMPDHIHLLLRMESDGDGRMISAPTADQKSFSRPAVQTVMKYAPGVE